MKVLLDKKHPLGRSYVAQLDNGEFKAGASEIEAKTFKSAREAYDWFYPHTETDHGAWNICYTLEDYL